MAVAALRSDRAARPLRGGELPDPAQAVPPLPVGPGLAQREAGAGPLPPIHPVRRRHGRRLVGRRRRRIVHARRRHARSARRPARAVCGEGQQPQDSRWAAGLDRPWLEMRASVSRSFGQSTSSIVWGSKASGRFSAKVAKTRSGDFTKGAELASATIRSRRFLEDVGFEPRGRRSKPARSSSRLDVGDEGLEELAEMGCSGRQGWIRRPDQHRPISRARAGILHRPGVRGRADRADQRRQGPADPARLGGERRPL